MPCKCRFHCLYGLDALLLGPMPCNWVWSPHHLRSLFFSAAALLFLLALVSYRSKNAPAAAARRVRAARAPRVIRASPPLPPPPPPHPPHLRKKQRTFPRIDPSPIPDRLPRGKEGSSRQQKEKAGKRRLPTYITPRAGAVCLPCPGAKNEQSRINAVSQSSSGGPSSDIGRSTAASIAKRQNRPQSWHILCMYHIVT
jgi:hypothetical protein